MAGPVNAIFAVGQHGEFAMSDGSLPWRTSASLRSDALQDMEHFKSITKGSAIVMGFSTYRTLTRPLVGRLNVVIDRSAHNTPDVTALEALAGEECFCFYPTLEAALGALHTLPVRVFLIGGKALFEHAFSRGLVDGVVYQTVFDASFPQVAVYFSLPAGLELVKSERVGSLAFCEYQAVRR